jgi:hypothetical protein
MPNVKGAMAPWLGKLRGKGGWGKRPFSHARKQYKTGRYGGNSELLRYCRAKTLYVPYI